MPVDLTGQLSNPRPAREALADQDIGTPNSSSPGNAHSPVRIPRTTPPGARPLKPAQVDALVAGYEAGKTMNELAAEYGIHRVTVSSNLRRAGTTLRHPGLNAEQIAEAAGLYEAAWSSGRLAERFGVGADTVLRALRQSEVPIRPRRGGPQPKPPSPPDGRLYEPPVEGWKPRCPKRESRMASSAWDVAAPTQDRRLVLVCGRGGAVVVCVCHEPALWDTCWGPPRRMAHRFGPRPAGVPCGDEVGPGGTRSRSVRASVNAPWGVW